MSKVCSEFKPHAYLGGKCRDCSHPQSAHDASASESSSSLAAPAVPLSVNGTHAHAFDFPGSDAVELETNCTYYTPHAWIYDRCRECGLSEASHSTSSMSPSKPDRPEGDVGGRGFMVRPQGVAPKSTVKRTPTVTTHGLGDAIAAREKGSVQSSPIPSPTAAATAAAAADSASAAPHPSPTSAPMSPGHAKATEAEEQMRQVVQKMLFFEQQLAKISAADGERLEKKEITQAEYDASIAALNAGFKQKESEIRLEVEAARRSIEEANTVRQREIEAAAEVKIAEAEERARLAVLAAESGAALEREEAARYKKEAEELRAQAAAQQASQAEAQQRSEQALAERNEADAKRREVEAQLAQAEQIIVAQNTRELELNEEQPAAPAPADALGPSTVVARDGSPVVLSEVLKNVEKLFQQGRNVVRFQANRPPVFSAVFIRALAATPGSASASPSPSAAAGSERKPEYSLCWTRADDRLVHPSRTLAFHDISAVVLGKQSSVFKQASAAPATDRCCVSFIASAASGRRSLHFQFGNSRDMDTWAYGVASLMKEFGVKPAVYEAGLYFEQESERARDFDQTPDEEDDGAKPAQQQDLDSIASSAQPNKYKIEIACKCASLPSEHKNTIVCLVDRDERTNKLVYLNQSERVSHTVDPTFKKKFPLTFVDTSAKTLRFNVYDVPPGAKNIEDEFRLGSAIVSIKSLCDKPGAEFVYTLSHKHPKRQERLTAALSTLTVSCASKVQVGTAETDEQRAAKEKLKATEHLMVQADTFIQHVDAAHPQSITLFYTPGAPPATLPAAAQAADDRFDIGHLNWAAIGAKPQAMALRSVVDVFVGKKAKVFSPEAREENCFSLVSKTGLRLDLEAKSKQQRDTWVAGIISFLKAASAQGQKDKQTIQQANAAAGIVGTPNPATPVAASPAAARTPHPAGQ